ncbi:DUF5684 domain-containing protein [Microbacterium sp. LWH10-1.2]|uniref:DUF5684 domain-containing protein n=1 Tax=Microbacterium sp. LWH10-1.2 TaxID=3135255 RepID=UPI0031390F73
MIAVADPRFLAQIGSPDLLAATAAVGGVGALIGIGVYVWYAIALSKLFPRLEQESWKGWVPVLNEATILQIGGRPAWNVVFYFIPIVQLYGLYLKVVATHAINKRFDRGAGFTVLAVVLPPVWATLLAAGVPPFPDDDRLAGLHGPRRIGMDAARAIGAPGAQGYLAPPIPHGAPVPPAAAGSYPSAPFAPAPAGFPPAAPGYPAQGLAPQAPGAAFPAPGSPPQQGGYDARLAGPPTLDETVPASYRLAAQHVDPTTGLPAPAFGSPQQAPSAQPPAPAPPAPPALPISQGLIDSVPGSTPHAASAPPPAAPAATGVPPASAPPVAPVASEPYVARASPLQPVVAPPAAPPASLAPPAAAVPAFAPVDQPAPPAEVPPAAARTAAVTPAPYASPVEPWAQVTAQAAPVPTAHDVSAYQAQSEHAVPSVPAGEQAGEPSASLTSAAVPIGSPVSGVAPSGEPASANPESAASAPIVVPQFEAAIPFAEPQRLRGSGLGTRADRTASIRPVPVVLPAPATEAAVTASAPAAAPAVEGDDEFDATVVVKRSRGPRRVLVLDDGRTFALSATSIVIGRNPEGEPGEQRLAIPDKTRTLSKTHARLVVQGDEWRLTDLHSTNGVVVVADDGAETLLDPGESVTGAGRFVLGEVGMHVAVESVS